MDYPGQGFTELKHTDTLTPTYLEGLIPSWFHTVFTSTWLCSEVFHLWIRNSVSPAPKHSELLASHRGDLRSEGHLYPYPSRATLDSRVLSSWSHSVRCTPTSHLHTIPVSSHSLIKRTINVHDTQWSILDNHYCPNNSISFDRELV